MHVAGELEQLNRLFIAIQTTSQQNRSHNQKFYDIRYQIEANYIADILIHANLTVPKLDRDYIQKLHLGTIKWKKNNGRSVSLASNFDFDLLEKLGLIFFEYDWVHFVGHLQVDSLPQTGKPIVKFVQKLQQLFYETYKKSNFLFEVDEQYSAELLPKGYLFNSEHVKFQTKTGKCIFAIEFHCIEYKDLICQFFWKKLIQYELDDVIWHKYYALERILDNFWMPDIKIFTDEERKKFLDFCMINIEKSSLIRLNFNEYQKILAIEADADSYFIRRLQMLEHDIKINKNIVRNEISEISLEEILLENFKDFESDWDLLEWYRTPFSPTQLFYLDSITRQSFSYVINHNLYLDSFNLSLSEYTKNLIEKSKENMIIRHYLLNIVNWNISNSTIYCLYLLSCNELFVSGCINLIDKIKRSDIHLNKLILGSFQVHIASKLARVIIHSSLQISDLHGKYREKDLAKLICFLTKKSNYTEIKDHNIELNILKEILKQLSKNHIKKLMPHLFKELRDFNIKNSYDLEKILYCLFELFLTCKKLEEHDLCDQIQEELFQSYKACFENALIDKDSHLRADKIYDLFAWHQLKDDFLEKIIQLCPKKHLISQGLFSESSLYYSNALRNYLQVLSNLDREYFKINSKLKNLLKKLIIDYGFDKSYSFPLLAEDYSYSSYPIWPKIIENLNEFDDQNFYEIIEGVKDNISLSAILALYRNISQESRKQKVSEFIKSKSWDMSDDNFSAIESAFVDAVEQKQLALAKTALQAAQKFIDQHPYKNAKMFQDKIHLWHEYQYKYDLLEIYYSENSIEEKEQKISQVLLPDFIKEKNYRNAKFVNIDRFKRHIIGLLFLREDPDKSYQIFLRLNNEYKSSLYTHFVFTSKLQSLFNSKAEKSEYLSIIDLYKQSFKDFYNDLPLHYKSDYLNALYLAEQHEIVSSLCSKLTYSELFYKSITVTYVKSLKDNQNELKANEHLNRYLKHHSVDLDDDELKKLQQEVQTAIVERVEPIQKSEIIKRVWLGKKSKEELRTAFRDINGKDIRELSWILSEKDPEEFLYDAVLSACQELLIRNKNLQILDAQTNEDITNDWLTSLLSHKFSWFPITIHDQKRVGKSASGKSPGEIDVMIMHQEIPVSMIEAFKLKSWNQAVINEHLNKIANYAQSYISPIFIVIYAYSSNFLSLTERYFDYIKSIQYKGFNEIQSDRHQVNILENKGDDIAMYYEKRYRGEKDISIYHILINLKIDL